MDSYQLDGSNGPTRSSKGHFGPAGSYIVRNGFQNLGKARLNFTGDGQGILRGGGWHEDSFPIGNRRRRRFVFCPAWLACHFFSYSGPS